MISVCIGRQQDSGFLERLAICRDREAEALRATERGPVQVLELNAARLRAVRNARKRAGRDVSLCERASRENPHAAHEGEIFMTTDDENLDAGSLLAQQQHRCGMARRQRRSRGRIILQDGFLCMSRTVLVACASIGILLVAVVFAPVPGHKVWISRLHDFAHGPIFGCVAVLLLIALRRTRQVRGARVREPVCDRACRRRRARLRDGSCADSGGA